MTDDYLRQCEERRRLLYEAKRQAGRRGVSQAALRELLPMTGATRAQRYGRQGKHPGRPPKEETA